MTISIGFSGAPGTPGEAPAVSQRARGLAARVAVAAALVPAAIVSLAAAPATAMVPPAIDPPAGEDTLLTMLIHPATPGQQLLVGLALVLVAVAMLVLTVRSLRGLKEAVTRPAPARSRPRKR